MCAPDLAPLRAGKESWRRLAAHAQLYHRETEIGGASTYGGIAPGGGAGGGGPGGGPAVGSDGAPSDASDAEGRFSSGCPGGEPPGICEAANGWSEPVSGSCGSTGCGCTGRGCPGGASPGGASGGASIVTVTVMVSVGRMGEIPIGVGVPRILRGRFGVGVAGSSGPGEKSVGVGSGESG